MNIPGPDLAAVYIYGKFRFDGLYVQNVILAEPSYYPPSKTIFDEDIKSSKPFFQSLEQRLHFLWMGRIR